MQYSTMATVKIKNTRLTQHLRHLSARASKDTPVNYHSCLDELEGSDLIDISSQVLQRQKGGGIGNRRTHAFNVSPVKHRESIYTLKLLKGILLAYFQLLCVSSELEDDVEFAFSEYRKICEITKQFVQSCSEVKLHCVHSCKLSAGSNAITVKFSDFAEVLVNSRSKVISNNIIQQPSKTTVLRHAKLEAGFIRALLGIFATFTNLLSSGCAQQTKMEFVSEEMFSMTQGGVSITWFDCLIPGAQSEGLRVAAKEMTGRLWGRVAERLVGSLYPVLPGDGAMEKLVPILNLLQLDEGEKIFCV